MKSIINNVVSGLSLLILVIFGAQYLIFKNTEPYQNLKMEITNNPVPLGRDIEFVMLGNKVLNCTVENARAVAEDIDGNQLTLNNFTSQYTRNVPIGENVTNTWSLRQPNTITPGTWNVSMLGDWTCSHWIFKETHEYSYDNILLIIK